MSVLDRSPAQHVVSDAEALDRIVARLRREFGGRHPHAVIADLVYGCRSELAASSGAAMLDRVERLARQRLHSGWASLLIDRQ